METKERINLKRETRQKITDLLNQFVTRLTQEEYTIEELQKAYPFHSLFFRGEALVAFKRQRSIVTKLGQGLFPKLARIVAEEHYSDIHLGREFRATVDGAVADTIDRIVTELRVKQRKPDRALEVTEALRAKGGEPREVVVTADLFIGDFAEGPFLLRSRVHGPIWM